MSAEDMIGFLKRGRDITVGWSKPISYDVFLEYMENGGIPREDALSMYEQFRANGFFDEYNTPDGMMISPESRLRGFVNDITNLG